MYQSPLEQFSITRGPLLQLWFIDITVTNSAITLGIASSIILTLFMMLLTLNISSMIPYFFSVNAHPVITIGLSLTIWLTVTITGFLNYGINYLAMFMPNGAPIILGPFLILIELVSYMARAISLGLRLAANVTSGHILLAIISGFAWKMILGNIAIATGGIFAILILICLAGLELAVAFIQAYVYTLLTTIYLNDAIHLH